MLITFLHCLAGALGFGLLYCGAFLYETEESEIHNRLDNWWVLLDTKSQAALKYHADMIQKFAVLALNAISQICGDRVYCLQNFFATACLSTISVSSFAIIGALRLHNEIRTNNILHILEHEVPNAMIFGTLFLLPLVTWIAQRKRLWQISVAVAWIGLYTSANGKPPGLGLFQLISYFDMLIIWALIVLCLMVFSGLSKFALRIIIAKSIGIKSVIVALIYVSLVAGTAIIFRPPLHVLKYPDGHGTATMGSDNIFVIIFIALGFFGSMWLNFALLIFVALGLLMLHSVVWGAVKRPIYAMSRHRIFNQHKTLVGIGLAFIAMAFKVPALILDMFNAF